MKWIILINDKRFHIPILAFLIIFQIKLKACVKWEPSDSRICTYMTAYVNDHTKLTINCSNAGLTEFPMRINFMVSTIDNSRCLSSPKILSIPYALWNTVRFLQ